MTRTTRALCFRLAAALLVLAASQVCAQANETDAAAFEPCRACHSLQPDGGDKAKGPNLKGLLGRAVAGDAAFAYSPALQAAGFAGEVWTAEKLDQFLSDPEAMFPGLWTSGPHQPQAPARKAIADFIADPNSR